jgi:hypothetical protein
LTATLILAGVLLVLVAVFLVFFLYSRTPEWGESEMRKSVLRMLVIVGPMLGMHYKPPRPTPPAVTTPKDDENDDRFPKGGPR